MAEQQTIIRIKVEGTSQLTKLKQEIVATDEQLKNSKKAYKDGKISQQEYAKQATITGTKLKALKKDFSGQQKDIINLNQTLTKSKTSYAGMAEENKKLSIQLRKLKDPLGKNKAEFDKLAKKIANNTGKMKQMDETMGRFHKNVGNYASGLKGFATKMAGVMIAVQGAIMAFQQMQRVVGVFADFQFAMAQVGAITNATDEEFKALEQSARDLGASTAFTATQVAGLQKELGKLGFNPTEINNMTSSILDLAFAFDEDLSVSAEQVGFVLKQFDLDASESTRVADVMATAFTNTALDLTKFSNAMPKVGVVAKEMGFEIEDTVTLLGMLADVGLDASTAGTSLRNIFLKMADPAGDLAKALGGPITSIEELAPAFIKLEEQGVDLTEALEMTDRRSATAFVSLVKNGERMTELNDILNNSEGAVKSLAEVMRDTLKGDLDELKSAAEGAAIEFIEQFEPALRAAADVVTALFQSIGPAIRIMKPFIAAWVTYKALQKGLVLGEKAWAAAVGVKNTVIAIATGKQKLFNKAALANPYMAVVAGIVAIVVAFKSWGNSMTKTQKMMAEHEHQLETIDAKYGDQEKALLTLIKTGTDEKLTMEERQEAVDELNASLEGLNESLTVENLKSVEYQDLILNENEIEKIEEKKTQTENIINDLRTEIADWEKWKRDHGKNAAPIDLAGEGLGFSAVNELTKWTQDQIDHLEETGESPAYAKVQSIIEDLNRQIQNGQGVVAGYSKEIRNLNKSVEKSTTTLTTQNRESKEYANTLSGMRAAVKDYTEELNQAEIGSENYTFWLGKLKKAKEDLKEQTDKLNNSNKQSKDSFERLSDRVSKYSKRLKAAIVSGKDTTEIKKKLFKAQTDLNKANDEYQKWLDENFKKEEKSVELEKTLQEIHDNSLRSKIVQAQQTQMSLNSQLSVQQQVNAAMIKAEEDLNNEKQRLLDKGLENLTDAEKQKLKIINKNIKDTESAIKSGFNQELKLEIQKLNTQKTMLETQLAAQLGVKEDNGKLVLDATKVLSEEEIRLLEQQLVDIGLSLQNFNTMLQSIKAPADSTEGGFFDQIMFGSNEGGDAISAGDFTLMVAEGIDQIGGVMASFQALNNARTASQLQTLDQAHFEELELMEQSAQFQNATDEQQAQMSRDLDVKQANEIYEVNLASYHQNKKANKSMAAMDGATAIMRIWASPSTLPEPARSIMNGVLTVAQVARTSNQLKTIEAQPPPPKPQIKALEFGGVLDENFFKYGGVTKFATGGQTKKDDGSGGAKGTPPSKGNPPTKGPPPKSGSGNNNQGQQTQRGSGQQQVRAGGMRKVEELELWEQIQRDFVAAQRQSTTGLTQFAMGGKPNGVVKGPSHANGGVKFALGNSIAELEGGEAIINKKSTAMYRPLLSKINQAGGGRKFAEGGITLDDEIMKQLWGTGLLGEREPIRQDIIMVEADVTNTQHSVEMIEARSTF